MKCLAVVTALLLILSLFAPFAAAQNDSPTLFDACPEAVVWWEENAPTLVEFLDIAEIALITPRVSLSPVLITLRAVQREYQRMEAPVCVERLSFYMNGMMEGAYSGFAAALGQTPSGFWQGFEDANLALYAASSIVGFDSMRQLDLRLVAPETLWGGGSRSEIEALLPAEEFPHEFVIARATEAAYTPTRAPISTRTLTPTRTPRPTRTPIPMHTAEFAISTHTAVSTAVNARVAIVAVRDAGTVTSELVEIRNNDTAVVDLSGWKLRDANDNEYLFPDERRLFGGGSVTLFTRVGEDTVIALFWDRQQPAFTRGEVVTLFDAQGRAQSTFTVP